MFISKIDTRNSRNIPQRGKGYLKNCIQKPKKNYSPDIADSKIKIPSKIQYYAKKLTNIIINFLDNL